MANAVKIAAHEAAHKRARKAALEAAAVNAEIERVLLGNICHADSDFWQPDPAAARAFYEAIMARGLC